MKNYEEDLVGAEVLHGIIKRGQAPREGDRIVKRNIENAGA
jgi:hypothetical protein